MPDLIEQIKFEEGLRLNTYLCTKGKRTIGYGRNLDARPYIKGQKIPDQISKELAEEILEYDIDQAEEQLYAAWHGLQMLTGARRDACINMAFQLGVTGFMEFKRMREALMRAEWIKARDEALNSAWARQTPARAERVAGQFVTNVHYSVSA